MDRCPPILAPSALGNRPPVQNRIEEERGSVFLRSGTVSEAPYLRTSGFAASRVQSEEFIDCRRRERERVIVRKRDKDKGRHI